VANRAVFRPVALAETQGASLEGAMKRQLVGLATWSLIRALRVLGPGRAARLVDRVRTADPLLAEQVFHRLAASSSSPPSAVLALSVHDDLARRLDEIPSETTPRERRALYRFFAEFWPGRGSVVEIGCFLGGTSRAIALGMRDNPHRGPGSRLHTFDRFGKYYSRDALVEFLTPLLDSQTLSEEELGSVDEIGSFLVVFNRIHKGCDYGDLILPVDRELPELPTAEPRDWFALPAGVEFDAFFVDGCKAWYATKYFMRECCRGAEPGSFFIFQDYLQFTCFWLPSFLETFRSHFSLVWYVDNTYAFRLRTQLSPGAIDAAFPDTPEALGRDAFRALFDRIIAGAVARQDYEAKVKHTAQLAAALTYIGEKPEARQIFAGLSHDPAAVNYQGLLQRALRSPTYRPNGANGEPILLGEG
jgi:hypothetical protein